MKKIKSRELLFITLGMLLLIATLGFVFYGISFLLGNIRLATNPNSANIQAITRFNLDGLKTLGIIQQQ